MTPPETAAFEEHLNRRGLPQFLPAHVRRRRVLSDAAPGVTTVSITMTALGDFARQTAGMSIDQFDDLRPRPMAEAVVVILSPLLAWVAVAVSRRVDSDKRQIVTLIVSALFVALGFIAPMGLSVPERLVWLALTLAAAYVGFGRIYSWAARRSFREVGSLGPMVGRVLPLLVFTLLSLFFTAEVWQVIVNLSMPRTCSLCAVIVGAGLVLAAVTTRDFVNDAIDENRANHPHFTPLRPGERFNIVLDLMLITLVQVALLAGVVFVFFLGFGALSITDATARAWMETDPEPLHGIWSLLPVNQNLLQVCLLLASVASLSFIANAASDPAYRRAFVEPAMNEMRDDLELRHRYLEAIR